MCPRCQAATRPARWATKAGASPSHTPAHAAPSSRTQVTLQQPHPPQPVPSAPQYPRAPGMRLHTRPGRRGTRRCDWQLPSLSRPLQGGASVPVPTTRLSSHTHIGALKALCPPPTSSVPSTHVPHCDTARDGPTGWHQTHYLEAPPRRQARTQRGCFRDAISNESIRVLENRICGRVPSS